MRTDLERQADEAWQGVMDAARARAIFTPIVVDGRELPPARVVELLAPHMSPQRMARIDEVVARRTRRLATVVEGLANSGNVAAVMRTAEALGVLPFHIVRGQARYKHSERTAQGADKWLDVALWDSPADAAEALHVDGYQIVVTHLDETAVPIAEIDFARPTALVFGNELGGASPAMLEAADARCIIPIQGFVESFNISVAAALGLYHAQHARRERLGAVGDLAPDEAEAVRAAYCMRSVRHAEDILRRGLSGPAAPATPAR